MIYYLINVVSYLDHHGSPQKVLPGVGVSSSDPRYQLIVTAGGVLFPESHPEIVAAANRCKRARLTGADEEVLEQIMQTAVDSMVDTPQTAQAVWHQNSLTGNDLNDGRTVETAIKTFGELVRRFGYPTNPSVPTIVYVYEDVPEWDAPLFSALVKSGMQLSIFGVPKVKRTGTVASLRLLNTTTGTPAGLTASGVSTWLPLRGLNPNDSATGELGSQGLIKFVTGANAPGYIWPVLDEGGGVARCSPGGVEVSGTGVRGSSTPPDDFNEDFLQASSPTDQWQQLRLPIIPKALFVATSMASGPTEPGANTAPVYFRFLQFGIPDPAFDFDKFITVTDGYFFRECIFTGSDLVIEAGFTQFTNCATDVHVVAVKGHCYFAQGATVGSMVLPVDGANVEVARYHIHQGCSFYEGEGGYEVSTHTRGFCSFDSTTTMLVAYKRGLISIVGPIWGTGNAGYIVDIGRGCQLFHTNDSTYQCTNPTMRLAGKTSVCAFDETVNPPVRSATPRTLSLANLAASYAAGGFAGNAVYPEGSASIVLL